MDLVDVKPLIKETVKTHDLMSFIKIGCMESYQQTSKHKQINPRSYIVRAYHASYSRKLHIHLQTLCHLTLLFLLFDSCCWRKFLVEIRKLGSLVRS